MSPRPFRHSLDPLPVKPPVYPPKPQPNKPPVQRKPRPIGGDK